MASRIQAMSSLYEDTIKTAASSPQEWAAFLFSASNNYKLRFDEQAMVYAQRSDATAVLELERWNRIYGRWVKKGARGIAAFDGDDPAAAKLKYYFDISDTKEGSHSRPVFLWQLLPEHREDVIETLAGKFGEDISDKEFVTSAIRVAAEYATEDNIESYYDCLLENMAGSGLGQKPIEEAGDIFFGLVRDSVHYMALSRCGHGKDLSIKPIRFDGIELFDTRGTIETLGTAASAISEAILREIASAVLAFAKEETNKESMLAQAGRTANNDATEKPGAGLERSNADERAEPDIYGEGGRGNDSGSSLAGAAGGEPREIRENAGGLPETGEESRIHIPPHAMQVGGTPVRDRTGGERKDQADSRAEGKSAGGRRGDEEDRPDEMGGVNDKHPPDGGAGGDPRNDPGLGLAPEQGFTQLSLFDQDREDTGAPGSGQTKQHTEPTGPADGEPAGFAIQGEAEGEKAGYTQSPIGEEASGLSSQGETAAENGVGSHEADFENTLPEYKAIRETAIENQERANYRITDDALGQGSAKAKYAANIAAIKTLREIEAEGRLATPDEQETLSRYVGWGSLPQAFDEKNREFSREQSELAGLLSPDEYESARASTLNAFYTTPAVIKAIYKAITNMGFKGGNILEPSCGTGNFMGLAPENMDGCKFYGVEIDSITGRIASQLYQKNDISIMGFEEKLFPDNFFDLAIGNVPFGSYGVYDKRYDRNSFFIHDYFFAKTLDLVKPGGVIAFITSKGTLDKQNPAVRRYIAQRAEMLGAIRLPNNAFLANAGTSVTADIVFLQKRDRMTCAEPDWVHLGLTESGIPVNSYFAENPDMALGEIGFESSMYGNEKDTTCRPFPDSDLAALLEGAIANIHADIPDHETGDEEIEEAASIPADPAVRNFGYTLVDGKIYFRENSRMYAPCLPLTTQERVKGMMEIRDCLRQIITYQTEGYPDQAIADGQARLNLLYGSYTGKYGLLNSRGNAMAFDDDASYPLLCALEIIDDEGHFIGKADMFTKRTIRPTRSIEKVDTPAEAFAVSISEKALVDMMLMSRLCGKTQEEIYSELKGVIFWDLAGHAKELQEGKEIQDAKYVPADEFLSGDVRQKLKDHIKAKSYMEERLKSLKDENGGSETHKAFGAALSALEFNIESLERVQPKDIAASEIEVRLGAAWLPPGVIWDFTTELLDTPDYLKSRVRIHYSEMTAGWNIEGKNQDYVNIKATETYGTKRINAYKIIEDTLNLKDVRIFDYLADDEGKRIAVLNRKETMAAQQKQEAIKAAFAGWVWVDAGRRARLAGLYNERFNSVRPRVYDGQHIAFPGINPEISLFDHQKDAVAHILYGGNTLLAHVVGAGKTFEMAAAAMESRRLGLCSKSLFAVPNHLTEQWASEFLQLYPAANILVARKKDFEKKNRRKFCSRIATGEYDAIIIGHSQLEKIPLSAERQIRQLERQIDDISNGIIEIKAAQGERYTIKQCEKMKKNLEARLKKLNDQSRKDDVVTFEELGVDRLFVDEAHSFKNLAAFTKMRNVAGISQTEAQKSSDLFAKCRYLDEITGYSGTVFATGTPISNSMVEMYTLQRYLQHGELERRGLLHFDAWASTFGEQVTAIELSPEGTGYRAKTRFARFYNLPELMNMFRQTADIQTADMLDLPVPAAVYHNVAVKPSEIQAGLVKSLAERADRVREKKVNPSEDNLLVITNEGRKIALDERLINPLLPDRHDGKSSVCADNVYRLWKEGAEGKLTQLVFCDISTPRGDGTFSIYADLKEKLMSKGMPGSEIAFIHDAGTEAQKKELFAKVRGGQVRVLIGSTQKMGAGTNVQDRLIASHDLDCPWRPSDLEQRGGRVVRQGNRNPEVNIFRYVTEGTFDAYLYQIIENKQRFISQIMTSKSPVRSAEDIDEQSLSYAEIKALATGNPYIKEKMDLDLKAARLKIVKSSFLDQKYALEDKLVKWFPEQIKSAEELIDGLSSDLERLESNRPDGDQAFYPMMIGGVDYTEAKKAGEAILEMCKAISSGPPEPIGLYRGFEMRLHFDVFEKQYVCQLIGVIRHKISLGADARGNITRIDNTLASIPGRIMETRERLANTLRQADAAKEEIERPFPQEGELKETEKRLFELNALLNMDEKGHEDADIDIQPDEEMDTKVRKDMERER